MVLEFNMLKVISNPTNFKDHLSGELEKILLQYQDEQKFSCCSGIVGKPPKRKYILTNSRNQPIRFQNFTNSIYYVASDSTTLYISSLYHLCGECFSKETKNNFSFEKPSERKYSLKLEEVSERGVDWHFYPGLGI